MARLTSEADSTNAKLGSNSSPCTAKSEPAQGSANTSPLHPLVYVRYKDHVLFKNIQQPIGEAVERETAGWLAKQNEEIILIENDRTIPNPQIPSGKSNGVIILRSCIVEIRPLPLQKNLKCHLNCRQTIHDYEYAFRPTERKTHSQTSKGAKKP